jgi:V8-like Glu-specific endopeptidase
MTPDLAVELINATVQLEQPLADGQRTVGTGFLVSAPRPDGTPRTVLVTAGHVFGRMPSPEMKVGYRISDAKAGWSFAPQSLTIREADGDPLWTQHPDRDVAVMEIKAPPEFAKAAIPANWLASEDTFSRYSMGPGDEMFALGFPRGLSANKAGFPILRAGRVASYPLTPSTDYPTFLLDFAVFPGNSGGPVFLADGGKRRPGASGPEEGGGQFIAGVLTQQVELKNDRLEIGIVTHAAYVREALDLLDGKTPVAPRPAQMAQGAAGALDAAAVASSR